MKDQDRLVIGVIYRSPNATDEQNRKLISMIGEITRMQHTELLIIGDFNYPGIDWSLETSNGTGQEHEFMEGFRDWFLWQHVTEPTRYRLNQRANILDLVMTNEQAMVENIDYGEPVGKEIIYA